MNELLVLNRPGNAIAEIKKELLQSRVELSINKWGKNQGDSYTFCLQTYQKAYIFK